MHTVEQVLQLCGPPVYVRKQIVHNQHVVATLERSGAIFVDDTEEVPPGGTVVFSAHGISPQVRAEAARRGLRTIDATCPLVTKVHNEARRFATEGYDILLIGHEGHEEVVGTTGEAPEHIHVVDTPQDAATAGVRDPGKVAWLSQTTLSVDETMATVRALQEQFPQLVSPPSGDICYATQNRQAVVKVIAPRVDLFLVVGSANSSNSVRMVEVARAAGAPAAHLVENADMIDSSWLRGVRTVGLSSGASVPDVLVREAVAWLAERGFTDLEEIATTEERLMFALPKELRHALRGAE